MARDKTKHRHGHKVPSAGKGKNRLSGVSQGVDTNADVYTDFMVSFRHLDREQGQNFQQWQEEGILGRAMDVLHAYCCNGPLRPQIDGKKFVSYGSFPQKSTFTHPKQVPEDAEWARIHVTGKQVLAGYIKDNVFNVVFLDKDHEFWLTEKKHT